MSNRPAFRASYHGWRLAMSRGMVQIIIEVPVEDSDTAYQVLGGMPNPGKPVWIGCARIPEHTQDVEAADHHDSIVGDHDGDDDPDTDTDTEESGEVIKDGSPPPNGKKPITVVAMAALRCKDVRFQKWLNSLGRISEVTEDAATEYVRRVSGGRRRNLGKDGYEEETAKWEAVNKRYLEHLDKIRYGI